MMHVHKCEKLQSKLHTQGYFGTNYWKLPLNLSQHADDQGLVFDSQ